MEPGKKKGRVDEEANLAANRKRYNKLIIIFTFFFISLTLIIVALITYLVRSEISEKSIHQNPSPQISTTESEVFKLSLQRAAEELENATSLLVSDHSDSTIEVAFNRCQKWLQTGSAKLREATQADPFPRIPSTEQRVKMTDQVFAAESYIRWCLEDLALVVDSSATASEAREMVFEAAAYLRERGDFLKTPRKFREAIWDLIVENLIVICLFGFQMLFIFFMFWKIIKSP